MQVFEWIDIFLSEYRWYRRLRKGVWYQVRVTRLQDCAVYWVRQPLNYEINHELVIDVEIY